jgi:hypothetical protein
MKKKASTWWDLARMAWDLVAILGIGACALIMSALIRSLTAPSQKALWDAIQKHIDLAVERHNLRSTVPSQEIDALVEEISRMFNARTN